jgi:quercetin dioxygenase-like cupin family protein
MCPNSQILCYPNAGIFELTQISLPRVSFGFDSFQQRRKTMKYAKPALIAVTALVAAGLLGIQSLGAQQPGFKRLELQRGDLSVAGREAVVVRADFDPDGIVGRHTHPGEESSYVIEGTLLLEIDGKPPVTLNAGEVFFIPAGVVHAAKNIGKTQAKVLATYIVEKGKPLATPAK